MPNLTLQAMVMCLFYLLSGLATAAAETKSKPLPPETVRIKAIVRSKPSTDSGKARKDKENLKSPPSVHRESQSAAPRGGASIPEIPRIDSLVMSGEQPHKRNDASFGSRYVSKGEPGDKRQPIIWYDDFDGPVKDYAESSGTLDAEEAFGRTGRSLLCLFEKGKRGTGNRKVFFGDTPVYPDKAVCKGETFDEIYWRVYVKHQRGWRGGGPEKMSRAISFNSHKWTEAVVAHVWSVGETLTLDPASGVRGSTVVTTCYNDGKNFRWLGNYPPAHFPISSTEESGWWVCVEAHVKLNTPGVKDGIFQLWIDGRLECERKNLDWRGNYTGHGINALFLESWWGKGSPVTQRRWYDNFVISKKPIGPVVCARNPELIKTPYQGPEKQAGWEVEIASDSEGRDVVWRSKPLQTDTRITVDQATGIFLGSLTNNTKLAPDKTYYCRVRQKSTNGQWSDWSRWHQPFVTESAPGEGRVIRKKIVAKPKSR
ncbi:MAG: hypothetical protein JRL30_27395 [Deltaproteobacteria bacterium]|nr:hypothetical protein [Deltaproteobacteria bacterium]